MEISVVIETIIWRRRPLGVGGVADLMKESNRPSTASGRTAIVHIGDRKTGSTTIQQFLTANKQTLARNGKVVSEAAFRRVYHSGLTSYALDDHVIDTPARRHWDLTSIEDIASFRTSLRDGLLSEAQAVDATAAVLFSHEDLFRIQDHEVERLAELLREIYDNIEIVVYLRRQADRDASEYGQALKNGHTGVDLLAHCRSDYHELLNRWARHFGEDAIKPRIFDAGDFVGGDLIDDFCDAAGLGDPTQYERVAAANESLSVVAQDFLRAFNTVWSKTQGFPFGLVVHTLLRDYAGPGRRPSRRAAEAHMAQYRRANDALRKRWFPERRTLFSDDFSMFPEREAPVSSLDQTMSISLRLMHRLGDQIEGLRANIDRTNESNERIRGRRDALRARFDAQAERVTRLEAALTDAKRTAKEALASKDPVKQAVALERITRLRLAAAPEPTAADDEDAAAEEPGLAPAAYSSRPDPSA